MNEEIARTMSDMSHMIKEDSDTTLGEESPNCLSTESFENEELAISKSKSANVLSDTSHLTTSDQYGYEQNPYTPNLSSSDNVSLNVGNITSISDVSFDSDSNTSEIDLDAYVDDLNTSFMSITPLLSEFTRNSTKETTPQNVDPNSTLGNT